MLTLQELVLSNRDLGFIMCLYVAHCELIAIVNRSVKSMMGERFQFSTLSIHIQICSPTIKSYISDDRELCCCVFTWMW